MSVMTNYLFKLWLRTSSRFKDYRLCFFFRLTGPNQDGPVPSSAPGFAAAAYELQGSRFAADARAAKSSVGENKHALNNCNDAVAAVRSPPPTASSPDRSYLHPGEASGDRSLLRVL